MFLWLLMEWNYSVSRILVMFSSNEIFFCCWNCLMLDSFSKPLYLCFNLDFTTLTHENINSWICCFVCFSCVLTCCVLFVSNIFFCIRCGWLNPTYLFGTKVSSKYILPCGRHIWFLRFALSSLLVDIMMCSIFFCVENIWWWVVWKCIDFVFTLVRE